IPTPDVAVLLDVGPEQAHARKPEYPVDYLRRRWLAYRTVFPWVGSAVVIKNDDLRGTQYAIARVVEQRLGAAPLNREERHAQFVLRLLLDEPLPAWVLSDVDWDLLARLAERHAVLLRLAD